MRCAVIGNCQARGVLASLRAFLPGAEGVLFDATTIGHGPEAPARAAALAEGLSGFDHIFAHPLHGARFGPLAFDRLAARGDVTFVPSITFTGYHPDCVYLVAEGKQLRGPMGVYHSALAATGFVLGLSEERTARLFNPLVLRRLGYLDVHAQSRALLVRDFAALGYDLAARFEAWERDGAFMHVINHPRILPIADTCRMALERAGLGAFPLEAAREVPDPLARQQIWPVYPAIARAIGLAGSWEFRPTARSARPVVPMTLEEFVAQSFAAYAEMPDKVATALRAHAGAARVLDRLPRILEPAA